MFCEMSLLGLSKLPWAQRGGICTRLIWEVCFGLGPEHHRFSLGEKSSGGFPRSPYKQKMQLYMEISMRKRIYPPTFITEFNLQGAALSCPHMVRDVVFEVSIIRSR